MVSVNTFRQDDDDDDGDLRACVRGFISHIHKRSKADTHIIPHFSQKVLPTSLASVTYQFSLPRD